VPFHATPVLWQQDVRAAVLTLEIVKSPFNHTPLCLVLLEGRHACVLTKKMGSYPETDFKRKKKKKKKRMNLDLETV
jgi:hypothetical protein